MTTVISGVWSALSSAGVTYYTSGGSTISGPVDLAAGTILNVSSGAVVSGLTDTAAGAVINISSGGTVENSTTTAATITVSAGGSLLSNTLASGPVTVNSGGKLAGNTYTSGTLLVSSGASISGSTIGAGETTTIMSGATATNLTVASGGTVIAASGTLAGFTAAAGGTISSGGAVYSGLVAPNGSVETALMLSGTWSAVLSGGTTVYVSTGLTGTTTTVTSPVALAAGTTLNISSGAVVSNLTDGSNTLDTINVLAGGELLSSKIDNGFLNVASGGITSGNLLNSDVETLGSGTKSINDTYTNTYDGDITSVTSGASVTGATVTSGGHMTILGGSVSNLSVGASGTVIASSGTLSGFTAAAGGIISSGSAVYSGLVAPNGTTETALILSGTWSAVTSGGATVYQSGGTTVTGAVALGGLATLNISSGAVVSNLTDGPNTLDTINVLAGGELLSSKIDNGYLNVASGGITSGNLLNSDVETLGAGTKSINDTYTNTYDGDITSVTSGASVTGATVTSGGSMTVLAGGSVSGLSVGSGGIANVSSGATLSGLSIATGGSAYIATTLNSTGTPTVSTPTGTVVSGAWIAEVVSGKTVYASGTQVISGPIHLSGGTLTVNAGAVASGVTLDPGFLTVPTVTVLSGGELLSSVVNNGNVVVSAGGLTSGNLLNSDLETVGSGAVSVNDIYNNTYDANQVIVASGGKVTGAIIENGNNLVVNPGGEISVAEITSGGTLNVLVGGIYDTCYLGGTMIRMQDGETPVEAIRPGDSVLACVDGVAVARPVVWVGRQTVGPVAGRPRAATDFPVRVREGALADGVPARDLLVTPEHCLYLEGGFVPARMLVNGGSIVHDTSLAHYEYFHIETDSHAVVWADGALSETYLDTGNRQGFQQSGLISMAGAVRSWAEDAAAPLHTDPVLLEMLFRRLQARAAALDMAPADAAVSDVTADPDLRVQLPSGQVLRPQAEKDGRFSVAIPTGTDRVMLLSRSARPSEMVGPFLDDRRLLGVRVGRVELFEQLDAVRSNPHLCEAGARGWHGFEGAESRWTDGAAELSFGHSLTQPGTLVLEIVVGGPYPLESGVVEALRLTA